MFRHDIQYHTVYTYRIPGRSDREGTTNTRFQSATPLAERYGLDSELELKCLNLLVNFGHDLTAG